MAMGMDTARIPLNLKCRPLPHGRDYSNEALTSVCQSYGHPEHCETYDDQDPTVPRDPFALMRTVSAFSHYIIAVLTSFLLSSSSSDTYRQLAALSKALSGLL